MKRTSKRSTRESAPAWQGSKASVLVQLLKRSSGTSLEDLAKAAGARVAVTSGREEKARWCKQLGADLVINYNSESVRDAVHAFAPQGVNVYWDATPTPNAAAAVDAMAQRGRIVFIAGRAHETRLPVGPFYIRNCTLYGFTVTDAHSDELRRYAERINELLAQRALRVKIAQRLALAEAARAHHLIETASPFGKIILLPDKAI